MNLFQMILELLTPNRSRDAAQVDATKPSPYHQLLNTPAQELNDNQKRDQLSGAIHWRNETRIDELFAVSTAFISKPAKYMSRTWLGEAVFRDCCLSILNKLLAAGCHPNDYLKSPKETRPLGIAVDYDRFEAIQWLLAHGADPSLGRPIVGAINHRKPPETQLKLLNLLIEGGADINQTFTVFGDENNRFTVLDWAETYGISANVIEFLKSKGAIHNWKPEKILEAQNDLDYRKIVQ